MGLVLGLPAPEVDTSAPREDNPSGETWLFVAHVGDSRAVMASQRGAEPSSFTVTAITRDHRADDSEEAAGQLIKSGICEGSLQALVESSRQQWTQSSSNETVD